MKSDEFMEAIDGMISISEEEPYIKQYIAYILRNIIEKMARKMFDE